MQAFPWAPKPVNSLKSSTASDINDSPALIWFLKDAAQKDNAISILTPISAKEKEKKESESGLLFYYHLFDEDEDEIGKSLQSFAKLPDVPLALIDIPAQKVRSLSLLPSLSHPLPDSLLHY